MSGRNSGRRNFGGRGVRGFKNNDNDGRQKTSTKKTLELFTFYIGSAKKANNYKNTALFVINNIKKDFYRGNDINKDLRKLEYKNTENWNPILKAITLSDDDAKERQDKQFKLQIKADYG